MDEYAMLKFLRGLHKHPGGSEELSYREGYRVGFAECDEAISALRAENGELVKANSDLEARIARLEKDMDDAMHAYPH